MNLKFNRPIIMLAKNPIVKQGCRPISDPGDVPTARRFKNHAKVEGKKECVCLIYILKRNYRQITGKKLAKTVSLLLFLEKVSV